MCYQTVLRFHIWLKETFSNSVCLALIENEDESAAVLVLAVFITREHVDSPKVFYNGSVWGFKLPQFSEPITSKIFKLWSWSFFSKCTKLYVHCKNAIKIKIMFRVFETMTFEHLSGISLNSHENTFEWQWTCYQEVIRLHIWLKEMFSNSSSFGLTEN